MPGAAGFPFKFEIDGIQSSWANITFRDSNPGVEASARLLPNGDDNTGFSDREYDLSTATITLVEPAHASDDARGDISTQVFGYIAGSRLPNSVWQIAYDEITIYSGTGIYISENAFEGSIPGAGKVTATIQAIGEYEKLG